MGYDLTLMEWSGRTRQKERSESIAAALRGVDLLSDVRSSYSDPDDLDCEWLAELIEEEADAAAQFTRFCNARDVDEDFAMNDPGVAAAFLDQVWGVSL